MALIKCPECGREISDKALACINCGYPLSKETADNSSQENNNLTVIKKFNKALARKTFNRCLFDFSVADYPDLAKPKMGIGNNVTFKDENGNYLGKFSINTCIYIGTTCTIGFDELDAAIYNSVAELHTEIVQTYFEKPDVPNEVKCPTCGSSDVERVSSMEKAVNIGMFGLFGNKRNKQFRCNNCKYMW